MANTSKYDRNDVIEKAKNLYWEKGFQGTSMRNLQDIIDMRPGSIYATFGSKEGLYKESLLRYAQSGKTYLDNYYKQTGSPLGALKLFVKGSILGHTQPAPSNMCMLVKTISELTDEHAELLSLAKELLKEVESNFALMLEKAQQCGELDKDKDVDTIAGYIQIQLMGLRTYNRANDLDDKIETLIDELFTKIIS